MNGMSYDSIIIVVVSIAIIITFLIRKKKTVKTDNKPTTSTIPTSTKAEQPQPKEVLTDEALDEVLNKLIAENKLIAALKTYIENRPVSLEEAKEYIDRKAGR